jgi:hypothetical protein
VDDLAPAGRAVRGRALIVAGAVTVALAAIAAVAQAAWRDAGATTHATFAAATEFPPVAGLVPSVLGTAQVGVTLHATDGAFAPTATSTTIAWLRCDASGAACAATGSTGADYTAKLADIGSTLRAQQTPANGATAGAAVRSEPTPAVLAINLGPVLKAPVADNAPAISGTAAVGQTLTAVPGTWLPSLVTFSYRWLRCDAIGAGCTPIAGATGATYSPVAADSGRRLSVAVTAALAGLIPSPAVSVTTAVVG